MSTKYFGVLLGWAAAAALLLTAISARADGSAPIPVAAFFEKPTVGSAGISPTGRSVALTTLNKDGFMQLVVLDTASLTAKVAASFKEADVVNVHWVSDKRLVFGAGDSSRNLSDRVVSPGLYAVDLDGTDFRQLARLDWRRLDNEAQRKHLMDPTTRSFGPLMKMDSDSMWVTQTKFSATGEFEAVNLVKLDTRTGVGSTVQRPGDSYSWAVAPDDVPRLTVTREANGRAALQYLDGTTWTKLTEFDLFTGVGVVDVVGFAPDGTLYVEYRKGDGTFALYTYDLRTKELSAEPVLSVAGFDVRATLDLTRDRLIGIHYEADARATYWIDPAVKEVQAKIDKGMPGTVNSLGVPFRAEVPFVLVRAYSDAQPGQFFLYDTKADKLVRIGQARGGIDATRMGRRDFVHYKARDGLEIPAWVTVPKDGKQGPRPMVVLVHGGPWVRGGSWQWDRDSQFLASRGYVVLEPEFRGSTGFGMKHFKAGWKQWGLAMQNDVADGTRWAIEKGIADPKRICIAGASYGGYATLMGLINDPDLYRCGFEWVGVTDIDLMYSVTWSDSSDEYKTYGMPVLIGDQQKDAAQLKATSPLEQAARIKQPLLMAYGAQDRRVPLIHSNKFRNEVQKTNKDVEWVVYPDEGHGWRELKTNVDWWTRVDKFLARNIGSEQK